jgi:hypothetical protein
MIVDIIGWVGTLLVLLAYYLVSSEKLKPTGNEYNLINFFGALFIGINVFFNQAWPAVALNIVWGGVAVISLVKNLRQKQFQSKR